MQLFEIAYAYKFLGGFYAAMVVLHTVLYLHKLNRKANLIYALGMLMVFINFTFTQDAEQGSFTSKINIITDLAANGALLYFVLYYVIGVVMPNNKKWITKLIGWSYAIGFLILLILFNSRIFYPFEIFLRGATYVVIGASCVIGMVKRIPNFHLIVIATLLLIVMWVFFGADLFNVWHGRYPVTRVSGVLLGFMAPFIAYSNYLSRYLSTTRKNLIKEQIINEQLSLINRQTEKIKELDQYRSRFFANVSHEFRTPLTLLLGPIEKRLTQATSPADRQELSSMHRNASRMLTLINQLLDLSRLEAGTLTLKCKHAQLHPVISSVTSQFSSMADSKGILFEVLSSGPVTLYFDADKLEQIITNLLSNAFKFTPSGGSVTLAVSQHDADETFKNGYVQIAISDTGPGIEASHLSKIFDRFYQVDMSSTREFEGSGIGLSLTKELVELHHGVITVTSVPGNGSTFSVKLPIYHELFNTEVVEREETYFQLQNSNDSNPADLIEESVDNQNIQSFPSVLLVEDNTDLRHYLKESLKHQFNITEARDGEEGIIQALSEVPDLIISDLMMPKLNGLQLCQKLKEDEKTSHIPILLLTARADVETKLQGYLHGADDYIPKPFRMEEVIIRIDNLIANRKRIQEKLSKHLILAPAAVPVNSVDERFLKRAMEVLEKFMGDSTFGVEQFSLEMGVSHTQLYRKLHAITAFNPNEFIRHMRLLRAENLLRQKAGNVAEVAYLVGFNNLSYFAKVFKEKFSMSPVEFLKKSSAKSEI